MLTKMISLLRSKEKRPGDCLVRTNILLHEQKTMSNDLEASTSRCKKQSRTSSVAEKSSVDLFQEDVKSRKRKAEIKHLEGRLRVLEEETEMLKEAFLESVEESKKLITEIHHHFKTINRSLLQREVDREELYSQIVQSTALRKSRRAGLLQILCQESNPSVVNKGLRTEALR